jgi:hypothetical protein
MGIGAPLPGQRNQTCYTVTTEMSGQISIELRSVDRFRHNLELLMSKSPNEAKSLLQQNYDPALCALTAKPGIEFESGRVTIKPAIAAEAGIGPYTVELQAVSPLQLSGKPHCCKSLRRSAFVLARVKP